MKKYELQKLYNPTKITNALKLVFKKSIRLEFSI